MSVPVSSSTVSVPKKPPRGNKSGKETGILMAVIKTLSSNATNDDRDRDREKVKLEKEFKMSDQRLEELISRKQDSLNRTIQTFGHICVQIDNARQRLHLVRAGLQKCKMLLHCGRGELEQLWLEGIEHKHALEILEKIDQLRCVTPQYNKLLGRKQYLAAAEILMNSLGAWNERLEQIEGLRDARLDLNTKKDKLYELLLEELNNEIYIKSGPTVSEMKRQGSGQFTLFQRTSSDRQSSGRTRMNQIKARKIYFDITVPNNSKSLSFPDQKSLGDSEDLIAFMQMVIKCIVLLGEFPRFVVDLTNDLGERLLGAVNHISQQIIEYTDSNGMPESGESILLYFLQLTFNHFRTIVRLHTQLLSFMTRAVQDNQLNVPVFSVVDIWFRIQVVLEQTLRIYFDLSDSTKSSHQPQPPATDSSVTNFIKKAVVDINSYFARKKQTRQKKVPLFKFEYSMHGLNTQESMINHESNGRSIMDKHRMLVCKPNPRNIIVIYTPIHEFISEIEDASGGQKCELRKFMTRNVERVFIQQIYKDISDVIDSIKKNPDSWKDVALMEDVNANTLKHVRPVLQNILMMGRSITEVVPLIKDLPSYCDQLLSILETVLIDLHKMCKEVYATIVAQSDSNEKQVVSAIWVSDEDIERLLKSLLNWSTLQKQRDDKHSENHIESPDDLRLEDIRESDLLYGVFGGKKLQSNEIMSNLKQLEKLSHFQESMDWFSETLLSIASSFEANCQENDNLKTSVDKLHFLTSEFQKLGDKCLLVLHLEVRIYCFYYLSPLFEKGDFAPGKDSQNPDSEVVQLSKILTHVESILNSCLHPVKFNYIFEGVGQLISAVVIRGAQDIHRINGNGIKKICRNITSIQQTLSEITNRPEQALEHARQYYELFLHPIDEVFDTILGKDPQFKEMEYVNVIQVLHRSKPGKDNLSECLNRLSTILGDVGVTV